LLQHASITEENTKQLHKSYMRALKLANTAQQNMAAPVTGAPTTKSQGSSSNQASKSMSSAAAATASMISNHNPGVQVITNPSSESQWAPSQKPASTSSAPGNGSQASSNYVFKQQESTTSDISDLLNGFDTIPQIIQPEIGTTKSPTASPTLDSQLYSPPFTSRSFDDLHCFLGQMVDSDGNATGTATNAADQAGAPSTNQGSSTSAPPDHPPLTDSSALFSAESYTIFAQESAIEASQYAACQSSPLFVRSFAVV
jgi:hypothetical protein